MSDSSKVSEVVARPVRTAIQGTPAWIVTEMLDSFFINFNDRQYGVLVLFLTMVFGAIQTAVENRTGKGLLRKVPPAEVPVVDQ